jgi:hypothetical protein
MKDRLQIDVLRHNPEYVYVLGGVNAITLTSIDSMESMLQSIYTQISDAGSKVVAITITPFKGASSWSSDNQTKLETVNTWIQETAIDVDYTIDMYDVLEDPSGNDSMRATYTDDWLHPNATGYAVFAQALIDSVTLDSTSYSYGLKLTGDSQINQDVSSDADVMFKSVELPTGDALANLSEDTTPQLGASLDGDNNHIYNSPSIRNLANGPGIYLDGVDDYIQLEEYTFTMTEAWSFVVTYRVPSNASTLILGSDESNTRSFVRYFANSIRCFNNSADTLSDVGSAYATYDGDIHTYAISSDATNAITYYDGVPVDTVTITGLDDLTVNYIGRGISNYDELEVYGCKFYNIALDSNQVWDVYSSGKLSYELQDSLKLDLDKSGIGHNQWTDISGNSNHGTVIGAVPFALPSDDVQSYEMTLYDTTEITLPAGYVLDNVGYYNPSDITCSLSAYFGSSDTAVAMINIATGGVGTATVAKGRSSLSDDSVYIGVPDTDTLTVSLSMRKIEH